MKIDQLVLEYVTYKKSLGMRFHGRALKLNAFARLMGPLEITQITPEMVQKYLDGGRPITSNWFDKYSALAPFYRYAISRGHTDQNPLPTNKRKKLAKEMVDSCREYIQH